MSLLSTAGAIYNGAAKSIGAAHFAAILGHLEKSFSIFSFRIIFFSFFLSAVAFAAIDLEQFNQIFS